MNEVLQIFRPPGAPIVTPTTIGALAPQARVEVRPRWPDRAGRARSTAPRLAPGRHSVMLESGAGVVAADAVLTAMHVVVGRFFALVLAGTLRRPPWWLAGKREATVAAPAHGGCAAS